MTGCWTERLTHRLGRGTGTGHVRFAKTAVGGFRASIARDASRAQNQRFGPSRVTQRDPYWTGEPTIGSFALRIVGTYRARTVRAVRPVGGDSRIAGQPRDGFPQLGRGEGAI